SLVTPGPLPPHRLEMVREALLRHVATGHGANAQDVTVVFDAQRAPKRSLGQQTFQGVRVVFAIQQSADDLIEDVLSREKAPRSLTVVSNDRRLQESARRRGCPVLGCLDYLEALTRPSTAAPAPPPEPLKPGADSDVDKRHWLKEFGHLDDDP